MKDVPKTLPAYVINSFFVLGLLSAVAFRILIVFQHVKPEYFRLVWYCGVIGYTIFFLYRYIISEKRKRSIRDFKLIQKIRNHDELSEEDRAVVIYCLSSIRNSKENYNYLFIFALSAAAILLDLALIYYRT